MRAFFVGIYLLFFILVSFHFPVPFSAWLWQTKNWNKFSTDGFCAFDFWHFGFTQFLNKIKNIQKMQFNSKNSLDKLLLNLNLLTWLKPEWNTMHPKMASSSALLAHHCTMHIAIHPPLIGHRAQQIYVPFLSGQWLKNWFLPHP